MIYPYRTLTPEEAEELIQSEVYDIFVYGYGAEFVSEGLYYFKDRWGTYDSVWFQLHGELDSCSFTLFGYDEIHLRTKDAVEALYDRHAAYADRLGTSVHPLLEAVYDALEYTDRHRYDIAVAQGFRTKVFLPWQIPIAAKTLSGRIRTSIPGDFMYHYADPGVFHVYDKSTGPTAYPGEPNTNSYDYPPYAEVTASGITLFPGEPQRARHLSDAYHRAFARLHKWKEAHAGYITY